MKKLLFFPYHPDCHTLLRYRSLLQGFEISGFISYKEDEKTVYELNGALGISFLSEGQLVDSCDAIVLLDNYREFYDDKYYRVIEHALRFGKEVFVLPLVATQLDLSEYESKVRLLEHLPIRKDALDLEYERRVTYRLHKTKTPTIGVFGLGKHCSKFENQLILKTALEKDYTAITLTSNSLGALFGCYTMPSFLFENCSLQEKIIKFNCFFRLLDAQSADIIIIGVPEGIMPFEKHEFHHFAEYSIVINTAIDIDMAVLCLYYVPGQTGKDLVRGAKQLVSYCQNKFEVGVDIFSISRTALEMPQDEHSTTIYDHFGDQFMCKYYPKTYDIELPLIDLQDLVQAETVIISALSSLA